MSAPSSNLVPSILLHGSRLLSGGNLHHVRTERYEIAWRGFVYLEGKSSGEASIRAFAESIGTNLADAAAGLRGVYLVSIQDKISGRQYAFVDNSALFHAYFSPSFIGTSFLEVAHAEGFTADDLDPDAVVEFLQFGCIYFGRTFFEGVRRIDPDVIVESRADGSTALLPKPLPDLAQQPTKSLDELVRSFCWSAASERVSVDLTGGIDSRLITVLLSYFGLQFDCGLSGAERIEDLVIAEEVAQLLDRTLFFTHHDPLQTNWDELFSVTDGLFDLAKSDRPLQMQRERAVRGVTLAVSGTGGELFKDFWWLQDFPLYAQKRANLERLYAVRFAPGPPRVSNIGTRYRQAAASLRQRMINRWAPYVSGTNTQTYDRIYYNLKMREFAGRSLTNTCKILPAYAPYLDREAVAVGYNLPRQQRFFNRYHRRMLTKFAPGVARLRTTEGGMSASAEPEYIASDLWKYAANRFSRLKTKIAQRRGVRVPTQKGPDAQQLGSILGELAGRRKTIQRLQDHGILEQSALPAGIRSDALGSLLALDMLLERLESDPACLSQPQASIPHAV